MLSAFVKNKRPLHKNMVKSKMSAILVAYFGNNLIFISFTEQVISWVDGKDGAISTMHGLSSRDHNKRPSGTDLEF